MMVLTLMMTMSFERQQGAGVATRTSPPPSSGRRARSGGSICMMIDEGTVVVCRATKLDKTVAHAHILLLLIQQRQDAALNHLAAVLRPPRMISEVLKLGLGDDAPNGAIAHEPAQVIRP